MNKVYQYERDENGDRVMFHDETGYWFAYSGKYINGSYRGRGLTKEQAVQDSINTTEKEG